MKLIPVFSLMTMCGVLLLSSCRSHKTLVKESVSKTEQKAEVSHGSSLAGQIVPKMTAANSTAGYVTAKMKFSISGMGKDLSVGGSLKMKRNDVIQLSLVAFGIIEAGKMEFTKDYVLVIDRINKRYIKVPYEKVSFLSSSHLDFNVLQSLFWNELFVPGKAAPSGDDFTAVKSSDNASVILSHKDDAFAYTFVAGLTDYLIHQVKITSASGTAKTAGVDWTYSEFTPYNGHSYPGQMSVNVTGLKQPVNVTMRFSRINNDSDWDTRIKVNSGYQQMDLNDLMKMIAKLGGN